MQAIIIGAGRGQRLMPTTADTPKCFAEVRGKRILDWTLAALRANGIARIAFVGGYQIDIVMQGFPGKAVGHGGLGWSTVVLIRSERRVALIDTGGFGYRALLAKRLAERGLKPQDITDLLLTHAHHDHCINWTLFSQARIVIGLRPSACSSANSR